jgi:hypothetical protein
LFIAAVIGTTIHGVYGAGEDTSGIVFVPQASIDLQAQRFFGETHAPGNLDQLYFRFNAGWAFEESWFSSYAKFRLYAPEFGRTAVSSATVDSLHRVRVREVAVPRAEVSQAWGRARLDHFGVLLGRLEIHNSRSTFFGDYLELGPKGGFRSRDYKATGMEITCEWPFGISRVFAQANDGAFNTGWIRARQHVKLGKSGEVIIGYSGNPMDRIASQNADLQTRIDAAAWYTPVKQWEMFGEIACLYASNDRSYTVPVLIGIAVPTAGILDRLAFEAEVTGSKEIDGISSEVLYNITVVKKFAKRFTFDVGVFSDPAGPQWYTSGAGFRFTTNLLQ